MSARDLAVDMAGTLQNPGADFELSAHDSRFPTTAFDREEAQLFNQQLNDLIADMPSSTMAEMFSQRQETIAKVAALAKHDVENQNFGGINAGDNELGFSVLRPGHIRYDGSNIQNNWYLTGSQGWNDWIGTSSNPMVINEDQVVLILGIVDQEPSPTEISGVNVDQFGRNMDALPRDVNSMRLQDNENETQLAQVQSLVGQEQDQLHVRLRYDRNVERQPRAVGFTFAKGRFLNNEEYSTTEYDNLP